MQRRGIAQIRQDGMRFDDRRFFRVARGEDRAAQHRAKKVRHRRAFRFGNFFRRPVAPVVTNVGKFSVEIRVKDADAFRERRMGFEQADERFADAVSKKHVRKFLGVRVAEARTRFAKAADFFQRAGDASRIARELDGRGVGEKFTLAADGGLNEPSKKNADVTDEQQDEAEQWQRILSATAPAAARRLQKNPSDDGEAKDAKNDSHEPEVQPHIAIENVAEFVADDALQFVARQNFHAAARDGDGRVAGLVAGGEGVDAVLLVHDIDLRHGHAGGDGHFLDDVEQLAFVGIGRVRV